MDHWAIYGRSSCPHCVRAKQLASDHNLNYRFYEIGDLSKEQLAEVTRKSNNHRTVPIIFKNGYFIGGCSNFEQSFEEV